MPRTTQVLSAVILAALVVVGTGCQSKTEGQPNSALGPPPDIKPGRGAEAGDKSGALDANASKKAKP